MISCLDKCRKDIQGVRMETTCGNDFRTTRNRHGHGDRFCHCRSTVIQRCICDIHTVKPADHTLVFIDSLQGTLRHFCLVGRICRIEFTAGDNRVDCGRNIVIIGSSAEKTHIIGRSPVCCGKLPEQTAYLHLADRSGQVKWLTEPVLLRNITDQFLKG